MAHRILVPTDGSPQARDALEYAMREFPEATFVAITALNPADMSMGGTEMGMASYADQWMEAEEEIRKHSTNEEGVQFVEENDSPIATFNATGM